MVETDYQIYVGIDWGMKPTGSMSRRIYGDDPWT